MKSISVVVPATWFAVGYAIVMATGLLLDLLLGTRLHFKEITGTHCKTPEYWPSISAATGDGMVERTVWRTTLVVGFSIRVVVSLLIYRFFSTSSGSTSSASMLVKVMGGCDLVRIFCALGWTLVASSEHLMFHETAFGFYMLSGFVLQIVQVMLVKRRAIALNNSGSSNASAVARAAQSYKLKRIGLIGQTVCALLVVFFFIRHNETCAPGAYSRSTMCEWGFAFFNLFFDGTQFFEMEGLGVNFGSLLVSGAVAVSATATPSKDDEDGDKKQNTFPAADNVLNLATRPSNAALWYAELFFGYFLVSSLTQLYQNVYFIPMVAMQFTPEVALIIAPLAPLLLRSSLLTGFFTTLGRIIVTNVAGTSQTVAARAPPSWIILYGVALLSYLNFDVIGDAGIKLRLVGVGPFFFFLGFYQRLRSSTWGAAIGGVNNLKSSANSFVTMEDTARLILSIPLGFIISSTGRVLYTSLDPLHVNAVFNAVFGLLGGFIALVILWRYAIFSDVVSADEAAKRPVNPNDPTSSPTSIASIPHSEEEEAPGPAHGVASAVSPALAGVSLGAAISLALQLVSTYNVLPRYFGIEPYPCGLLVPVAFFLGVFFHRAIVYEHSPVFSPTLTPYQQHAACDALEYELQYQGTFRKNAGQINPYKQTFVKLFLLAIFSFLMMYFGAYQSNRMFEKTVGITETMSLEQVDISQWYAEDMWGSVPFAFAGGLLFIFCLGVALPHIISLAFVATRSVNSPISLPTKNWNGTKWYSSLELWFFLSNVLCMMMQVYVVTFPFVPGGFLVRDRMWLVILVAMILMWFPLLRILTVAPSNYASAKKESGSSTNTSQATRYNQVQSAYRVGIIPAPVNVAKVLLALLLAAMFGRWLTTPSLRDATTTLNDYPLIAKGESTINQDLLSLAEKLYKLQWTDRNAIANPRQGEKKQDDDDEGPDAYQFALKRHEARVDNEKKYFVKKMDQLKEKASGSSSTSSTTTTESPKLAAKMEKYNALSTAISSNPLNNPSGQTLLDSADAVSPVSAMIWTIHYGLDNFGVDSVSRLSQKIKDSGAGIIGLLETDSLRVFNGNRDVVEYIAQTVGYTNIDYGPTTLDSTFGCALITKYKILSAKRYVMPSPMGELACLIHAKLDIGGFTMNTYVGHWGNTDHVKDIKLQSQFLGKLAKSNPGPSIFLGYLTTKPSQGNYRRFVAPYPPVLMMADDDKSATSDSTPNNDHAFKRTHSGQVLVSDVRARQYDGTISGLFRDTAKDLYEGREWSLLNKLGGFAKSDDKLTSEEVGLREIDQSYKRQPEGEKPRVFQFSDTQRFSTAHPRFEFMDRYCQYVLWKSGLEAEEDAEHVKQFVDAKENGAKLHNSEYSDFAQRSPIYIQLADWWRVLDIDELSDTEIQVAHFHVKAQPKKEGAH